MHTVNCELGLARLATQRLTRHRPMPVLLVWVDLHRQMYNMMSVRLTGRDEEVVGYARLCFRYSVSLSYATAV